MRGARVFPDPPEKNDRWQAAIRLFEASTLSELVPDSPQVPEVRNLWLELASRIFKSGTYDPEDEIRAHHQLTGASVANSFLRIRNRYALNLLASRRQLLPRKVEEALVAWLWNNSTGIGYLDVSLAHLPGNFTPAKLDRWFSSIELMLKFQGSLLFARQAIHWLWSHKGRKGLWDFGPRPRNSTYLPLSANWRRQSDRENDHSTRVLILMKAYYSL